MPHKTVYISKRDSNTEELDTIIIRHSYNSEGLVTNEVYTDYNDSLLRIRNYEYNSNKDVVLRSDHEKKEVGNNMECHPGYTILKDSIVYDYTNNVYDDHLVTSSGVIRTMSGPIGTNIETAIYDEFGNLLEKENVKMEYKYDVNGNWIFKKKYFKQNGELVPNTIVHRKIKYR